MSTSKYRRAGLVETPRPTHEAALRLVAVGLRSLSAALARLSRRLARPASHVTLSAPQLEFHADDGAPEGALYFEGQLVGRIVGVRRL